MQPAGFGEETGPKWVMVLDPSVVGSSVYLVLETNASANITAELMAAREPPFYVGERFYMAVMWNISVQDGDENDTVEVMLGIDELQSPEGIHRWEMVLIETGDHVEGVPFLSDIAVLDVEPSSASTALVAQVSYGNETVNLTYAIEPLPARLWLFSVLDHPDDFEGYQELTWAEVPVTIWNVGGADGTNLVFDFRYGGRIVATESVPALPSYSHYNLTVSMVPTMPMGVQRLEVYLVQGLGAPCKVDDHWLSVRPAAILEVASIEVSDDRVESGSKITVEVMVRNRGNATAENRSVEFLLDGAVVDSIRVDGIVPGGERVFRMDMNPGDEGTHSIAARLDGDDLDAKPLRIRVVSEAPTLGAMSVLFSLGAAGLLTRAARRSA